MIKEQVMQLNEKVMGSRLLRGMNTTGCISNEIDARFV